MVIIPTLKQSSQMKKAIQKTVLVFFLLSMTWIVNAQAKRNLKQEESNKKLVVDFYQKIFGDKDFAVIDTYVDAHYIQHNPSLADGREALKNAVTVWLKDVPKSKVDFQHIAADGDLVILHVKTFGQSGKITAITEIFKVKDSKIVEHWDVIQEMPEKSANAHPLF
jgi:predicted SnoaL-like aldol condensation-catalyzing enzyme